MKIPKFQMTNDSITVVHDGKSVIVRDSQPNFTGLRQAIFEKRWDDVPKHLTVAKSLNAWAKGKFTLRDGNTFEYKGTDLPPELNDRIVKMAAAGMDPQPLFRFWEKLQKNPSMRSVEQLFPFLKHQGIPLTKDGDLLAYKSVQRDYMDHHSRTCDNHPGNTLEMPRNKISDDPEKGCHYGFHVGALSYAESFGSGDRRIVICKVDPADVVCIPYDSSYQKMRVCKYEVIGLYNGLPLDDVLFVDECVEHVDEELSADSCADCGGGTLTDHCCWCPTGLGHCAACDPWGCTCVDCVDVEELEEEVEELPAPEPDTKIVRKKSNGKSFSKLDKMDFGGLMDVSIDELRKYARNHLKIIGASKIPGGKWALVSAITRNREG